jgi:hypothetical protein
MGGGMMTEDFKWEMPFVLTMALFLSVTNMIAGCSVTSDKKTLEVYEMFGAAGFQLHTADTPKKLDHLRSLPQKTLVKHQKEGKYYYVDAASCECIYIGDEKAYQRFKEMNREEKLAEKVDTTSNQKLFPFDSIYDW